MHTDSEAVAAIMVACKIIGRVGNSGLPSSSRLVHTSRGMATYMRSHMNHEILKIV